MRLSANGMLSMKFKAKSRQRLKTMKFKQQGVNLDFAP
jgi:hypothetical protein